VRTSRIFCWSERKRGSRNLPFEPRLALTQCVLPGRSLFESILLGIIAGAVGLGLCWATLKLLSASHLVHLPRAGNIGIDVSVLFFTLSCRSALVRRSA
jgi:hypothetical protein